MRALPTVGVILAGGEARRMGGGDKPLLEVGGTAMLSRVIAALRPELSAIAISANGDPRRFAAFGLPILPDGRFAGEGPLAGVLAGLEWAHACDAEALLTVPGDTPFVPRGLAAALAPPPACAASRGQPHRLVALWPAGCRAALLQVLEAPGRRDVAHFAARIGTRVVDFPIAGHDPFLNINTPEELAAAQTIAEDDA
jgi:molybdopterin-guanine dinucleotide biosynthesis protein A